MFGIGVTELLVILGVALIVLGPERLPEVAKALGKGLAELRRATSGLTDELRDATRSLQDTDERSAPRAGKPKRPARGPANTEPSAATAPPSDTAEPDQPAAEKKNDDPSET